MPDPHIPPGSSNSYDVPAALDAVDVSVWFEDFADTVDTAVGLKLDVAPTQSVKTVDATFALADATGGKSVVADKATAIVFTIPPQASVAFGANAELHWFNKNDGLLTIAPGAGVTFIGTALTFTKGTGGKAVRTASNEWVVLPFSVGSGAAVVSGTTGSPSTASYTEDGQDYDTYTFNGDGTLTSGGGEADVFIVGGGGGAGVGNSVGGTGGGGGGEVKVGTIVLPPGTVTVTVGDGGVPGANGSPSSVDALIVADGGGAGGDYANTPTGDGAITDGSGGGGGGMSSGSPGVGGVGVTAISAPSKFAKSGSNGAISGSQPYGGGGGGAGEAASGKNGGAGIASKFRDGTTAETYGGGGGAAGYTVTTGGAGGAGGGGNGNYNSGPGADGTANTGGGAGAGGSVGTGGSGRIIIRVKV